MPFVDPLQIEEPVEPAGKRERKALAAGFIDPVEVQERSVTIPETEQVTTQFVPSQQGQTQFIGQMPDVEAALDRVKSVLSEKSGISEFSLERASSWENAKPALIAAGAISGTAYGAPLGPGGMLAGGVLGAGLATAGIGAAERQPIPEQIDNIAKEMREEALFTGGAMAIGPAFKMLGPKVGKIFGLDDAGIQQLVKDAERNKIPIALQDVVGEAAKKSGKLAPSVAAGFPKVVGVFPFAATPQRKAAREVGGALELAVERNLNTIAPNVTLSKLGIDTFEAAKNTSKQFRSIANGLYDNFYKMADDLGQPAIVPTKSLNKAIADLAAGKARPTVMVGGVEKALPAPKIAKDLDNYLKNLQGLKEYISPAELRAIEEDINRFSSAANIKGYDVKQLSTLKQALEIAKQDIDIAKAADPAKAAELKNALDTANQWYAAGMALFSSPAGKKFTKVDKNLFTSKFFQQGEITADNLGPVIIKAADSPQMIKDLRNIVGVKQTGDIVREVIDQAKNNAVKDGILDFYKLEKNLRLNTDTGIEVMDELMKGTGISREKIQSLINVGKVHGSVDLSEASTFLKRRLLLGGIGTAGLLTQPKKLLTVAVPALILLRGGSKFLASPKALRWMTTALDDTANDKIRRIAAVSLIEQYAQFQIANGLEEE